MSDDPGSEAAGVPQPSDTKSGDLTITAATAASAAPAGADGAVSAPTATNKPSTAATPEGHEASRGAVPDGGGGGGVNTFAAANADASGVGEKHRDGHGNAGEVVDGEAERAEGKLDDDGNGGGVGVGVGGGSGGGDGEQAPSESFDVLASPTVQQVTDQPDIVTTADREVRAELPSTSVRALRTIHSSRGSLSPPSCALVDVTE